MNRTRISRFLAWFGIGLGVAELVASGTVARATGLRGHERLLRWFGLREIGAGAVILFSRDPARWLWLRTAGDMLDGALLASGARAANPNRGRALLSTVAVAPVVLLDVLYSARTARS